MTWLDIVLPFSWFRHEMRNFQIIDEKYLHSAREELARHLCKHLETDSLRVILEATEIDSLEKATEVRRIQTEM